MPGDRANAEYGRKEKAVSAMTNERARQFREDGYLIVEGLFDAEEMELLIGIAKADRQLAADAHGRADAEGKVSRLTVRNELSDDIYSAFVRCPRIVEPMEKLLGGEVYHWHHKMMLKEPRVGGAWEWHQDFGYWYQHNYCLFPHMGSCMIAVDRAERANGCLQVLKGSHHCGRIEHGVVAEQTGADVERVNALTERLPLVHVELDPGSAVFFHANLLHRSDRNTSENPRWTLICCYNAARNDPYGDSNHPRYTPLEKGSDADIKQVGRRQLVAVAV